MQNQEQNKLPEDVEKRFEDRLDYIYEKVEIKQFIAEELSKKDLECKKAVEEEVKYYSERFVYDRKQGFSIFLSMLTTILTPKTDPGLIKVIVEDMCEEFNKMYAQKTPSTRAIESLKENK